MIRVSTPFVPRALPFRLNHPVMHGREPTEARGFSKYVRAIVLPGTVQSCRCSRNYRSPTTLVEAHYQLESNTRLPHLQGYRRARACFCNLPM